MLRKGLLRFMQPICTHTISIQSSKPSHAYPIIRLPREFRELAGSQAEIYQTSYEDGIAFLVKIVDRSQKKLSKGSNSKRSLHTAEVAGSNPAEPICFWGSLTK